MFDALLSTIIKNEHYDLYDCKCKNVEVKQSFLAIIRKLTKYTPTYGIDSRYTSEHSIVCSFYSMLGFVIHYFKMHHSDINKLDHSTYDVGLACT